MNKRVSIFISVALFVFCQSATAMGLHLRYRKKLSAARPVRATLRKEQCNLIIHVPLFTHAVVQAAQTTKCTEEFKKYLKELERLDEDRGWTQVSDSKKFYDHVLTHIPWNGKYEKGAYPVLLNEREVAVETLCYQDKNEQAIGFMEVFTKNNDYWRDAKHHGKILQQFNKLIELPIADSFQIHQREYDGIKNAVFAKKGKGYAELFDIVYRDNASEASIIALSKEFDEGSCRSWEEWYPPRSLAFINGQKFWIDGKIGAIIYDHQNS